MVRDSHRPPHTQDATRQRLAHAFPHARDDSRRRLADVGLVQAFGSGDIVNSAGSDASMILVLQGYVGLRRTTDEGRELVARVFSQGELAAVAGVTSRPAVTDTVSLSPCWVLTWPATEVGAFMSADVGLAVDVLGHALRTLDDVVEGLDGFIRQDAIRRVARVLYRYRDLLFGDPPVLTRHQLPALVGISREMTGRVLRTLEARRVVVRRGRHGLELRDPTWLERLGMSDRRTNELLGRSSGNNH